MHSAKLTAASRCLKAAGLWFLLDGPPFSNAATLVVHLVSDVRTRVSALLQAWTLAALLGVAQDCTMKLVVQALSLLMVLASVSADSLAAKACDDKGFRCIAFWQRGGEVAVITWVLIGVASATAVLSISLLLLGEWGGGFGAV